MPAVVQRVDSSVVPGTFKVTVLIFHQKRSSERGQSLRTITRIQSYSERRQGCQPPKLQGRKRTGRKIEQVASSYGK